MCQQREEIGAVLMRSKEKIAAGTSHLSLQAMSESQASVKAARYRSPVAEHRKTPTRIITVVQIWSLLQVPQHDLGIHGSLCSAMARSVWYSGRPP